MNVTEAPLRPFSILLGCCVLVFALSGCATTDEHLALSKRVKDLEDGRALLEKKMTEDVLRLKELNDTINRSEATLRKSGANLGLRVSYLEQALPKAEGRVDVVEHRLKLLLEDANRVREFIIDRLDAVRLLIPRDLPSDADGMWAAAKAKNAAEEYRLARAILERFEASFPKDKRAIKARLLHAQILEKEGKIGQALNLYRRIESLYPGASEIPATILRMGELYVAKGDCNRAEKVYRYLAGGQYKDSPESATASERLETLKTTCGN